MSRKKRIIAIAMTLIMALCLIPATSFAESANPNQPKSTAAVQSSLIDYLAASVNSKDNRIGQYGTTNVKQYFFTGAAIENENGGVGTDAYPYANSYGYRYSVLTDTSITDYWANYIQEGLNSKEDINFGFFLGGSQTAQGSDAKMQSEIVPRMSIQKKDGTKVLTGEQIYSGWKHQRIANGAGSGGGPLRGFDVFLTIPAKSLSPNMNYVLVFDAGMGMSARLDKKIIFNFTTAPIKTSSVKLDKSSLVLKPGNKTTLKATAAPTDASNKTVTWSSSNKHTAVVNEKGQITAKAGGNTMIIAKAKDGSGAQAACKINVIGSPGNLNAAATYNSVKVLWRATPSADGYEVYKYNSKSHGYKLVKTTKALSYSDKKLSTGKSYTYKVRAYKLDNKKKVYGDYSTKKTIKTVPVKATIKVTAKKYKAAIKWSKVAGADKYVLYKSGSKNGKFIKQRITVKTGYTDTNVKKGKTYYYKVRSYRNVNGKKIYSPTSKIKTVKIK